MLSHQLKWDGGLKSAVDKHRNVNSVVGFRVKLDTGGVMGNIHGHLWYYFIKASVQLIGLDPFRCCREQDSERKRQILLQGHR